MPEGIQDALLIYNPTSGGRRHRRFLEIEQAVRILKDAGITTEIAATTAAGSAQGIARQAVEQRRGMVIACGGDGTINEIINGLAGSAVPMALLPAGTANILAKELRIPWDIPHAARLIHDGVIRRVALGLATSLNGNHSADMPSGGRYFLSVGGAGPDGAIVNAVNGELKKRAGVLAYWAEGLRQLVSYDFPEMRVRSDGQEHLASIIVVGQDRELWRAVQDHYRRELVRGFVRVSDEFDAQPAALPRLSARAVAGKTAQHGRHRGLEGH